MASTQKIKKQNNVFKSLMISALVGAGLMVGSPAAAWNTPEHIGLGDLIAGPFQSVMPAKKVPVIVDKDQGPGNFGDWVSAPDFGRSPRHFLERIPVRGEKSCSSIWAADAPNPEDDPNIWDKVVNWTKAKVAHWSKLDCVDGAAVNNNHFGDFAAKQYVYFHNLALEAAARYRQTRNLKCQQAAYTLEAWGDHYLTDTFAAGHAYNPPGNYDNQSGFNKIMTTSLQRMRIHNAFNKTGVLMSSPYYDDGTFWGDSSDKKSGKGTGIVDWDGAAQYELVMKVGQMALAQVIAAAECGAATDADDIFRGRNNSDTRRVMSSNLAMCSVFYGNEIPRTWQNAAEIPELTVPGMKALFDRCRNDKGKLSTDKNGALFATSFFTDQNGQSSSISNVLDPLSKTKLEDLGCTAAATSSSAAVSTDLCGQTLCKNMPSAAGVCASGLRLSGGCCFATAQLAAGTAEDYPRAGVWTSLSSQSIAAAKTQGVIDGDPSLFIWAGKGPSESKATSDSLSKFIDTRTADLPASNKTISACGKELNFSYYEMRVKLPRTQDYAEAQVNLRVKNMDEALRVQVNGQLVGYYTRAQLEKKSTLDIALFNAALPARTSGTEVIRLTQLNECGNERPLKVELAISGLSDAVRKSLENKADSPWTPEVDDLSVDEIGVEGEQGCSMNPTSGAMPYSPLFVLMLLGLALARRTLRRS